MTGSRTSRRAMIAAGVAVFGAVAYGGTVGVGYLQGCGPDGGHSQIAAARIGRELLREGYRPDCATVARFAALARGAGHDPEGIAAFERRLSEDERRDFARGDVVVCDGWVLSRTEADFCASVAAALEGVAV